MMYVYDQHSGRDSKGEEGWEQYDGSDGWSGTLIWSGDGK